jgi:pyruvate ferredoxin oxidoreductase gamma subunit
MYRIRFHGRGGQGMKTAGRILGTAFFYSGFEVQDSPRYGAERRGAPLTAAVRAAGVAINERGVILKPDLVVVADDTLVPIPAAGVMQGIEDRSVILIDSNFSESVWQERLQIKCVVHTLPAPAMLDRADSGYVGSECAGAAARLIGEISQECLIDAVREELADFSAAVIEENVRHAVDGYERMANFEGTVSEGTELSAENYVVPDWVDLDAEDIRLSGPAIEGGITSVEVRTGLWRTMRPVIEYDHCNKCSWVCGSFCPDSAITVNDEGFPEIDYEHCKGCMICVAQCPPHAITAIPETSVEPEAN